MFWPEMRPFQGFWGTEEETHLFQGIKRTMVSNDGNKGTKAIIWGTGHIGNQDFVSGEQGNNAIYFRETNMPPPREGF